MFFEFFSKTGISKSVFANFALLRVFFSRFSLFSVNKFSFGPFLLTVRLILIFVVFLSIFFRVLMLFQCDVFFCRGPYICTFGAKMSILVDIWRPVFFWRSCLFLMEGRFWLFFFLRFFVNFSGFSW